MILSRWFKLDKGVEKSREGIFARIASVFEQSRPIDDDLWDELEELLLDADVCVQTTDQLLEILRNEVELGNASSSKDLYRLLREELVQSLEAVAPTTPEEMLAPPGQLGVLLVVGVNGVGKTTSIAKLASYWHSEGKQVMLAAADTFRAAAIDQLKLWGERVGVPVVAQNPGSGGRPADRRHRRPPAHESQPDGGAEEDPSCPGAPERPARAEPARARRL